jgi:hypothetical protein
MIVLRCEKKVINLESLASCQSQSLTAKLTRQGYNPVVLTAQQTQGGVALTVPGNPVRGVWTLTIETTDCGCFTTSVFYDGCPPLQVKGEHLTSGTSTNVTVCCE